MKRVTAALAAAALLALGWFNWVTIKEWLQPTPEPDVPIAIPRDQVTSTTTTPPVSVPTSTNGRQATDDGRPSSFNLQVPFTTQAPYSNWNYPYQEACEEAVLLTVHYYWQDKTFTPDIADREILALVDFQNQLFGSPEGYRDTDAAATVRVATEYWPGTYDARVIYDFTIKDVEREVAAGRPVIAFFAGKLLGNPNFRNGGPLYHALVIKGYTPTTFITNDVGTRKGADYVYAKQTIMNAAHEWNGGDVLNGRRAMLVLTPR